MNVVNVVSVERGCAQFAGGFLNYQPQLLPDPGKMVSVFDKSMYLVAMMNVTSAVERSAEDIRFKAKLFYVPQASKWGKDNPSPDWFRTAKEVLVVVPTNNKLEVKFYPPYMEGRI